MNKLYVLTHVHKLDPEKGECLEGHVDSKYIGTFRSKKTAEETKERYKNLPGFRNQPENFRIDEYTVDTLFSPYIDEFIQEKFPSKKNSSNFFYFLYHVEEYDDGHDDARLLAIFSTKKKAEKAISLIHQSMCKKPDFEIDKRNINNIGWTEGFVTVF